MLSRPPASLAASISRSAASLRGRRVAEHLPTIRSSPIIEVSPSLHSSSTSPVAHRVGPGVDLDVGLEARARG